jgi:predicted nucleic acid-binding protein
LVIWDTNILALYFAKRLSGDDALRMDGHVAELERKREPVGIPAQVLAEFLEGAKPDEVALSFNLLKTTAFKVLPYDMRAAVETVEVSKSGHAARKAQKEKKRERQAVKVDWQIIAVAKANSARLLVTNDADMISEANRCGLTCMSIADFTIPDELRQHPMTFSAE